MPNRREFLQRIGAVAGGATAGLSHGILPHVASGQPRGAGGSTTKDQRRPNVLLITTDQQSIRAMGAYGNPYVDTPAMDSLAEEGVRFASSYCTSPVCGPARGSLLTGMMPHDTGHRLNLRYHEELQQNGYAPSVPSLGDLFSEAGYDTVYGGKWHLPLTPKDMGFNHRVYGENPYGSKMDQPLAEACADYIRTRDGEAAPPFLMMASFVNPHDICYWIMEHSDPEEHPQVDQYPPLPSNFEVSPNEPEFIQKRRNRTSLYGRELHHTYDWPQAQWRAYLAAYYQYVREVDQAIGTLLEAVREAGEEEETLIVFTSDHGEGMAAHRWVVKLSLYEESAGVPMIVSWKGNTPAGAAASRHPVSGVDVLPTLCDYAGVEVPDGVRGQSLRPVIEQPQEAALSRPFVVTELMNNPEDRSEKGRMLRTEDFKYVVFSSGKNREQLFHMKRDPGEMYNLAGNPDWEETLQRHRKVLRQWIADTDDDFEPMPAQRTTVRSWPAP